MVGVAGGSQACHTCKRRKLRCDYGRPHCQKCRISGRICEGYTRQAVFLNRTADGPVRRARPEVAVQGDMINITQGFVMPPQLRQDIAISRRIEDSFLETFLASSNSTRLPSPGNYVLEVITTLPRDWLLEPAIQALCFTKLGRKQNEVGLIRQGHQTYILALKRLQYAVSRAEHARRDSTFAAAKLLNLRELYEPTLLAANGLYSHTAGLTSLMLSRGVELKQSSNATRLILEAARYNAMIGTIQKRQESLLLARAEWRTDVYQSFTDLEQSLYDIGFDIGNLLGEIQRAATDDPDKQNLLQVAVISALTADRALSYWFERLSTWNIGVSELSLAQRPIMFQHIRIAHLCMDYWALKIVLNTTLEKLSRIIHREQPDEGALESPEMRQLQMVAGGKRAESMKQAEYITLSLRYCRRPDMGLVGPQRTMFANCIALAFYRSCGDAQEKVQEVLNTMNELNVSHGLDFGDDMGDPPLPDWARRDWPS